jgi:hypothetical protein
MNDNVFNAQSLTEAYQNFFNRPLIGGAVERFGVQGLFLPAVERICRGINESDRFEKRMIVAHSGCGKSTLLYQLAENEILSQKNHIIRLNLTHEMNLMNAEPVDMLLVIYIRMLTVMPEIDITPPLDDFEKLIQQVIQGYEIQESGPDLLKIVSFKFKTDSQFRESVRNVLKASVDKLTTYLHDAAERFSGHKYEYYKLTAKTFSQLRREDVSDKVLSQLKDIEGIEYRSELKFVRALEELLGDIQTIHYKPIILKHAWHEEPRDALIFMDDSDKLMTGDIKKIFFKEAHFFTDINARIVFTFPLFAYHSFYFSHIREDFVSDIISPVPLYNSLGEPAEENQNLLKELIGKRINRSLISDDALNYLIENSGGVFRDLIQLMQDAVKIAIGRNIPVIDLETAETAGSDAADKYGRFFNYSEFISTINEVIKTKDIRDLEDTDLFYLLRYHFVLKYGAAEDDEQWYDAHPYLKISLKKRQDGTFSNNRT